MCLFKYKKLEYQDRWTPFIIDGSLFLLILLVSSESCRRMIHAVKSKIIKRKLIGPKVNEQEILIGATQLPSDLPSDCSLGSTSSTNHVHRNTSHIQGGGILPVRPATFRPTWKPCIFTHHYDYSDYQRVKNARHVRDALLLRKLGYSIAGNLNHNSHNKPIERRTDIHCTKERLGCNRLGLRPICARG